MKHFIGLALIASLMAGCGSAPAEDLEVGLDDADAVALPFKIKSCTDIATGSTTESLAAASVNFGTFSFRWSGQQTVKVQSLTIKLKGSSLSKEYVRQIGATELEDTFGGTSMTIAPPAPNTSPTTFTTGCEVRVGGVEFKDPNVPGFALGTITLFGIKEDSDQNKEVVISTADISVRYEPLPVGN